MRLVVLFVLASACGGSPPPAPATSSTQPSAPVASPPSDHAPQLFSLEQLRAGTPQGRVIELRIELEGQPTRIQHMEFTAVDAERATIRAITRDESGTVLADETASAKWADLHKHGQFPAAATTIEDNVSITVPAGTFTTRLYTVKAADATRRFWFATELPGPPVQFTTEQGGKVVMRAQMLRAR